MQTFNPQNIGDALATDPEVVFALLFGSALDGKIVLPHSDIDVGVYFSKRPSLEVVSRVIGLCQDAINFEKIDLSVLNTASPLLAYEALKGKLIFCRDKNRFADFFSLTFRIYEDEMLRIQKAM